MTWKALPRRCKGRPPVPVDSARLREMYLGGEPYWRMTAELRGDRDTLDRRTLRERITALGLPPRSRAKPARRQA